jgi:DNA topoisomerase-3
VKRLKERKKNVQKSYYQIFIEIEDGNGEIYKLYMNKKFDSKKEVLKRMDKVKFNFYANLKKIKLKKKKMPSPSGLKTLTMLKMASLQLGLSPSDASNDAQKLYMHGLISYPRTKSTKYSENFDFKSNLRMFTYNTHFSKKVNELLENFDIRNIDFSKGDDQGGHEPIIPTSSITEEKIPKRLNWDLYECICLYYFASLSPDLEYLNKEYVFHVGDYKLKLNLSKIIKEGFLKFLPLNNIKFVERFPLFEEDKHYKIVNIDYEKKYYPQLNYLTEAELIDEMEKNHIGTDGSTPSHIKNLSARGYVRINENRRIIPTKLGVALIDSLNNVVPDIVKPENRANIEEFVKGIELGEKSFKEVIDSALNFYKGKLKYCCYKIDDIKDEFKKYFEFFNNYNIIS